MVTIHNSDVTFAIDIICDAYDTTDPVEIVAKVKEILDIDVTISQVMDQLTYVEDVTVARKRVSMKEFFNETIVA
jgi:hypothetical protein